jgi:DNA-directed RNA polymerase sigma subunit (sigma70/sigma32)
MFAAPPQAARPSRTRTSPWQSATNSGPGSGLNRQQRAVLVLRYYEDLSDATIAGILDVSEGNVRVIAHRALSALRQQEFDA